MCKLNHSGLENGVVASTHPLTLCSRAAVKLSVTRLPPRPDIVLLSSVTEPTQPVWRARRVIMGAAALGGVMSPDTACLPVLTCPVNYAMTGDLFTFDLTMRQRVLQDALERQFMRSSPCTVVSSIWEPMVLVR